MDSRLERTAPFWSLPISEVLTELRTAQTGLTETEAKKRLAEWGPNSLEKGHRTTHLAIFLRQLKSPLIFILLIAGALTIWLGDATDAIFILLAAGVNAVLGYYQENKAEESLEHLKNYITDTVRVTRGGNEEEIDAKELVPGDIIYLMQGDRVPADARVIHDNDLQVDQAILTGESLPSGKNNREVSEKAPLADQTSMVWSGTMVLSGFGYGVVTATDDRTQLGKIAKLVGKAKAQKTPLQKALTDFTLKATGFVFALSVVVFFIAQSEQFSTLNAFLISVAILVAAVPEALPIVMTVILAIGSERLAKRNGVVRRLSAAETLGSTSIILTDKTGTLTQAKLTLARVRIFEPETDITPRVSQKNFLLHAALLNINVALENPQDPEQEWKFIGKPLEIALAKAAAGSGIHFPSVKEDKEAIHILPFNSLNKFAASLYKMPPSWFKGRFKREEPHVLSLLGAPEILLKFCDISEKERARIVAEIKEMADSGERVIGVAVKEVEEIKDFHLKDHTHLNNMKFIGTLSFRDPLRPGVPSAVKEMQSAGIRVIIVTGDLAGTARAIAREIGIDASPSEIINGVELDEMSDLELEKRLPSLKIVSRVSPEGKHRLVEALQKAGETVAMNGDGINDAPALRAADIAIAMGSGTDVSKDVSDLVLLDDNFETIVAAIKEGRRILDNIRKAIVYLTSTILNEAFLIGGSLIMGFPVPLTALQILWVNFFTDSFPGVSLAFEEKIDSATTSPTRIKKGLFTTEMRALLTINGVISSLLLFMLYGWLINRGYNVEIVKTFIFAAFGTYSLFLIFSIRSLKSGIYSFNPFSNMYLVGSVAFGFILTLASIYLPILQRLFHTVSLPLPWLLGVVAFGIANVILIELTKLIFNSSSRLSNN